jgi:hypothetical protein
MATSLATAGDSWAVVPVAAVRPDQGLTFSPLATLAGPGAIAGSPAGRGCGAVGVTNLSFGKTGGEVPGRVVRMMPGVVLVASGSRLYAAWDTATGWAASPALAGSGVVAAGSLTAGGAWVLLPGHRAATVAGPGQPWRTLPAVPAGTTVLAAGPGGAVDALAVSGSNLTVWRLAGAATAWSKIQTIDVPVQYGSSS